MASNSKGNSKVLWADEKIHRAVKMAAVMNGVDMQRMTNALLEKHMFHFLSRM